METIQAGDLVRVGTSGPAVDGIVFDVLSEAKVVVAIRDRTRGPVMRTVERAALSERAEAGPDDRALALLVRRTPRPSRGGSRSGAGAGVGRGGFARPLPHRATGK